MCAHQRKRVKSLRKPSSSSMKTEDVVRDKHLNARGADGNFSLISSCLCCFPEAREDEDQSVVVRFISCLGFITSAASSMQTVQCCNPVGGAGVEVGLGWRWGGMAGSSGPTCCSSQERCDGDHILNLQTAVCWRASNMNNVNVTIMVSMPTS